MIKIGIVGSRSWPEPNTVRDYVKFILEQNEFILVSGGCKNSPDDYAEDEWRKYIKNSPIIYKPEFSKGCSKYEFKKAAFARNTLIADESDFLVCFFDPKSKTSGCLDTVSKMKNKPFIIVTPDWEYVVNQSSLDTAELLSHPIYVRTLEFISSSL